VSARPIAGHEFRDPQLAAMAVAAEAAGAQMSMTATAPPTTPGAGRPQPQTTTEKSGGPFVRHTQPGNLPQYISSGNAFGGLIQQPLVSRPGYYRDFRILIYATGGSGTTTVAATADAPYNVFSLIQFKDPFGTLLFSLPSYEALLVHEHSGGAGCGLGTTGVPANLPSFSAVAVGANASGNFTWSLTLPLEFAKGVGTVPGANASLQPSLQLQMNPSTSIYSTAPTVLPTVSADVESDFYWLPEGAEIAPPALGTSRQWILQQGNPTISSGGNQRIAFPRLGGYLDTLILEIRDSTNARIDAWPAGTANTNRLVFYIDGVPIEDSPMWKLYDDYFVSFRGITRPTGVYVFTRKTSLKQETDGLLDTGETTLSTNPGTLLEVAGNPWGTVTNAPATLNVIVGQIVPRGRMVQGLPEI
jgi:hypothetical protein